MSSTRPSKLLLESGPRKAKVLSLRELKRPLFVVSLLKALDAYIELRIEKRLRIVVGESKCLKEVDEDQLCALMRHNSNDIVSE